MRSLHLNFHWRGQRKGLRSDNVLSSSHTSGRKRAVLVKANCSAPTSSSSAPRSSGCTFTMNRYGLSSQALATALRSCREGEDSFIHVFIYPGRNRPLWSETTASSVDCAEKFEHLNASYWLVRPDQALVGRSALNRREGWRRARWDQTGQRIGSVSDRSFTFGLVRGW